MVTYGILNLGIKPTSHKHHLWRICEKDQKGTILDGNFDHGVGDV